MCAAATCVVVCTDVRHAGVQVGVYTPLAADVGGPVKRLLVEPGVSVRVAGLKQVALRCVN